MTRALIIILVLLITGGASAQQIGSGQGGVSIGSKPLVKAKPKPAGKRSPAALAPPQAAGGITYMQQLAPVSGTPNDTDQTFWCSNPSGCGPGVNLNRISIPQISGYVVGKLGAVPPIYLNGGTFNLGFDSTLSVVGGQLHANSSGGSDLPSGTFGPCINLTVGAGGVVTSLTTVSCPGGGGTSSAFLIDTGSKLLIQTGSALLIHN